MAMLGQTARTSAARAAARQTSVSTGLAKRGAETAELNLGAQWRPHCDLPAGDAFTRNFSHHFSAYGAQPMRRLYSVTAYMGDQDIAKQPVTTEQVEENEATKITEVVSYSTETPEYETWRIE